MSLNNWDDVEILNESTYRYQERTIYTFAHDEEQAADKFSSFFEQLLVLHQYTGVQPMTLWLFERIQDGMVI